MKILITTVKLGMGHFFAAVSLKKQLEKEYPEAEIIVLDFLAYVFPNHVEKIYDSYTQFVKKGLRLYNLLYQKSESKTIDCQSFIPLYFVRKMEKYILTEKPDIVISTCSLCSQIISLAKRSPYLYTHTPFITCITDFSNHPSWVNSHTDFYLVGSQDVKDKLLQKGIPATQICVNGIPVREDFYPLTSKQKKLYHAKKRQLLIMGGGLGLIPNSETLFAQLNHTPHIQTTVIVGNNHKLLQQLQIEYPNLDVVGYTEKVANYMQQADLILTKPGGLSLSEAIQCETPLLLFQPKLEQEVKNCEFALRRNFGQLLSNPDATYIEQLINDEPMLLQMRKNMQKVKQEMDAAPLYHFLSSILYAYAPANL